MRVSCVSLRLSSTPDWSSCACVLCVPQIELYAGLVIMCGFVLYDTQLIVEKSRMGNDDYIWCVQLYARVRVCVGVCTCTRSDSCSAVEPNNDSGV